MIKENELRIGSWGIQTGEPYRFAYGEHIDDFSDITNPMPLTSEILEKVGFEYYPWEAALSFTHMIKSEIVLRLHNEGCSVFNFSPCDASEKQFVCQVKYVHQLQNIWLCLKEEELKIEL